MALINQYRTYLENDESTNKRVVGNVFADIIKKLEGDIVPIEVYSRKDNLEEEEKILDKIQQL
jgi:ribosomal protein S17E